MCLRFSRSALKKRGSECTLEHASLRCIRVRLSLTCVVWMAVVIRDEEAKPVGDQEVGDDWGDWVCPHVLGGIPPDVVDKEFPMKRDGKAFACILGLTDQE